MKLKYIFIIISLLLSSCSISSLNDDLDKVLFEYRIYGNLVYYQGETIKANNEQIISLLIELGEDSSHLIKVHEKTLATIQSLRDIEGRFLNYSGGLTEEGMYVGQRNRKVVKEFFIHGEGAKMRNVLNSYSDYLSHPKLAPHASEHSYFGSIPYYEARKFEELFYLSTTVAEAMFLMSYFRNQVVILENTYLVERLSLLEKSFD